MSIPHVVGEYAVLPEGRHRVTMDEIEERFVWNAPFPEQRRLIFDAFTVWFRQMNALVPDCRYWIDGGFATHKPWAPPKDIDVVVFARLEVLDALPRQQQLEFDGLLTSRGLTRTLQPMGGLVDAYFVIRGDTEHVLYWQKLWSSVKDPAGMPAVGLSKGFLEVVA